ncbi:MAG: peptide deformylase [Spirochaetes bacterium]|nr:peptide deformylase [Spirochaetota bacterium]
MKHNLVYYGKDTLKQTALPVEEFNSELKDLSEEMFLIMKKNNGIGLAAPQINLSRRIITIELSVNDSASRFVIVNPEIEWLSDDRVPYEEGCLSIPGIYENVDRPSAVKVRGYDLNGNKLTYDAENVFARVLQHEIDHLNGILFIDRIEEFIRKEYLKELKKIKKMNRDK